MFYNLLVMDFKYFSRNGKVLPIGEAVVPLSNIEYSYGFGVYETIRVSNGVTYFLKDHAERLMESARLVGLEHTFTVQFTADAVSDLVQNTEAESYNLKVLLIGASAKEAATLSILCLNPLFPDKKLYRDGASFITREHERMFPHAKTLNMLGSYLALRDAKTAGAYDALLIDRRDCITEGTRTNFFCMKERTIVTPKESDILLGVTRKAVLKVALKNGFALVERDIKPGDLGLYDGAFVTSSSSKIVPVRSIEAHVFGEPPAAVHEIMRLFDVFLAECKGMM